MCRGASRDPECVLNIESNIQQEEEDMNEVKKVIERPELINAIRESISDARYSATKLAETFTGNIQHLRLEESEKVFTNLTQNIQDLACFVEFVDQLREGVDYYNGFGLPPDPISADNSGLDLFQEMHTAMASKDWVMLSDLIEYELSPLLQKEDEWLGALGEKVHEYRD